MLLLAYTIVTALFGLWFNFFLAPARQMANPGIAAYKPPPGTAVDYRIPVRVSAPGQPSPLVETESWPERPLPGVPVATGNSGKIVEQSPERIIDVKKPPRLKSPAAPRERSNPLNGYAAARSAPTGAGASSRYHGAGAYQGYLGDRLF